MDSLALKKKPALVKDNIKIVQHADISALTCWNILVNGIGKLVDLCNVADHKLNVEKHLNA